MRAWLHGRVVAGTATVEGIQRTLHAGNQPILDPFFKVFSFFGEEEFYLIVLPFLAWNVDSIFARRMTYIVCLGLVLGNYMKDLFQLPRPSSKRVENLTARDSTGCRDFGWPSTHALNAISNSGFTLLYLYGYAAPPPLAVFAAAFYCANLTFSRLYLGAHTPIDCGGGLVIGTLVAIAGHHYGVILDNAILAYGAAGLLVVLFFITLILKAHPHPAAPTPTYIQNVLLLGLFFGQCIGFWWYHPKLHPQFFPAQICLRSIIGYALVFLTRGVVKTIVKARLSAAKTKFLTYTSIAFMVVAGCPMIFDHLI
eukprot:g1023.t1